MNRSGLLDGLWRAWPVASWLLPVLFSAHGLFSTFGGWAWSFLLFTAPVVIPACGLLGVWPYRMLRQNGHDTVPWSIGLLLLVNWWATFAAILLAIDALSRQNLADAVPSLLRLLGAAAPAIGFELGMMALALLVAGASWAAIWILAKVESKSPPRAIAPHRGVIAVRAAAVVLPLLMIAVVAVGSVTTGARQDSAGGTAAEVLRDPVSVQAERALLRYEEFQQRVAEVRAMIADQAWETAPPYGLDSSRRECDRSGPRCYGFLWGYRLEASGSAIDPDAVARELADAGWTVEGPSDSGGGVELVAVHADGVRVEVGVLDGSVDLEARSAWWWGDGKALTEALADGESSADAAGPFAAREWPPLPR
ncbi:hypothetical protein [Microbacterium tumbae]